MQLASIHSRRTLLVSVLLFGAACDSRSVPEELPPFQASLVLNTWPWPASAAHPFPNTHGAPSFCLTQRDSGPAYPNLVEKPNGLTLDQYCVVYTLGSAQSLSGVFVSAGALTLVDAHGATETFAATRPGCAGAGCDGIYQLRDFSSSFALTDVVTLQATGDVLPAFTIRIPAGTWPTGTLEFGKAASQTTGLPFTWKSQSAGERLSIWMGTEKDNQQFVDCWFDGPGPIGADVVQWVAKQGGNKLRVGGLLMRYVREKQGNVDVLVRRAFEFDGFEVPLVP